MHKLINIQALRYLAVGIGNTAFSYSIYAFFLFLGLSYQASNLAAVLIGILFSYTMHGNIVFKNATPITFVKFIFAWICIYLGNITIIAFLMRFHMNAYLAGSLALIPVTFVSFFVLKFFVFARK
ncbi:GtrA family protein [Rhodoferax sp. U11-2br]|uniref:GtrA family protein n=1 Tax=Rhodoferax sp. U11-2br TaxID=2838878 RepID=UPI001BEA34E9|nr:GtrA family protein [Rhodoferax sp. U11-2br]MBT3067044.1 GtrA family protein [Rhodoferax sp. U11-2br]